MKAVMGVNLDRLQLVTRPTPVQEVAALSTRSTSLWVKRDDLTNPMYGGNKPRKLEWLLADAKRRGADRIVTVGAVGSHHVLATGVFARSAGMSVEAVVVPQPGTDHVVDNLRVDLAFGVTLIPASSYLLAAVFVARRLGEKTYCIPAGGSNGVGTRGYVEGARELAGQVREGRMPEPDLIVVALGSGGTAAGLLAGLAVEGMRSRVLAVTVAEPAWLVERMTRRLAVRCAPEVARSELLARLEIDRRYLGAGYGHRTEAGSAATIAAASVGLTLDPTYTAKTFAAVLDRMTEGRAKTILYWHTLSSAPMGPLLAGAPSEASLDPALRGLVRADR
jgi:1-aminocyclopropane-1-carboxylate deaminase/D-cysteine desulfhydrase-like pyridoxal-dependent ACC family enzyme